MCGFTSSVGRASHRYRGGHGFESRWSPDFFRLLLSNCLNWKINCDDHSPLSSTTAVYIWIISYKLHITLTLWNLKPSTCRKTENPGLCGLYPLSYNVYLCVKQVNKKYNYLFFFQAGTVTNPAIRLVLSAVRIFLSLTTVTVTLAWVFSVSFFSFESSFWCLTSTTITQLIFQMPPLVWKQLKISDKWRLPFQGRFLKKKTHFPVIRFKVYYVSSFTLRERSVFPVGLFL